MEAKTEKAADLHGHFGPFLVLGVRMGETAKKILEISANFQCAKNGKKLRVKVNPKITDALMKKLSEGLSNEELAWEIASMTENQIFTMKQ
jgi:formylmethanofuran dehydrogenase subunit E